VHEVTLMLQAFVCEEFTFKYLKLVSDTIVL